MYSYSLWYTVASPLTAVVEQVSSSFAHTIAMQITWNYAEIYFS